ncbi:enhanced serine sensitivity protein SseB C-terminal domain-containing protein [Streptacidiphilus anmyonensis]|uniref:enhanced serine sensitivity protein SseB C-terminal domain-containing protein n=1 Tax=Streptacidiphilus anmyonensis TaxID=405782 RepID=UPI001F1ED5B9|nr:enhanced serine sensitivity protein SseB C-terminal domain-containing protein [Streptacidiphilus anmyonensis]
MEAALRGVAPGRYDRYEELLRAVAEGRLWMLLWHGMPGDPDAQYGNLEVGGYGYAPCVTSQEELSASGWARQHQVISGAEVAAALYRERWGLWLNPHQPGGGLGIPWPDLRRVAGGLDRLPAGPLGFSPADRPPASVNPSVGSPDATSSFYRALVDGAGRNPAIRSLRRAWVEPAFGEPSLTIGLDLDDVSEAAVAATRRMMLEAVAAAPGGLPVSSVTMADPYDPVAMWLWARVPAFYSREAQPA